MPNGDITRVNPALQDPDRLNAPGAITMPSPGAPSVPHDSRLADLATALGSFSNGVTNFGNQYFANQNAHNNDAKKTDNNAFQAWMAAHTPDERLQAYKDNNVPTYATPEVQMAVHQQEGAEYATAIQNDLKTKIASGEVQPQDAPGWVKQQRDAFLQDKGWTEENNPQQIRGFGTGINSLYTSALHTQATAANQGMQDAQRQTANTQIETAVGAALDQGMTPAQAMASIQATQRTVAGTLLLQPKDTDAMVFEALQRRMGKDAKTSQWVVDVGNQPRMDVTAGKSFVVGKPAGLLEQGNIDLNSRPVVKNPDGSVSTVRSMSANIDGKEVLLPTVSPDGKVLSEKAAIDLYMKTGQNLGKFDTPDNATAYAQSLHEAQAKQYVNPRTIPALFSKPDYMNAANSMAQRAQVATAKQADDDAKSTVQSDVSRVLAASPDAIHSLPDKIAYKTATGAVGEVSKADAIQAATNATISRDNQRVASGIATSAQVLDEQLHTFAQADIKQPQWQGTLKAAAHGAVNLDSLNDPQQQGSQIAALKLYNDLQAKNPAYAASIMDAQTQRFFRTAAIQQQMFGQEPLAALQAAQKIWATPKTEEEARSLAESRRDLHQAAAGLSWGGWFDPSVKNPQIAKDAIVDSALSLVHLQGMAPKDAVQAAQKIAQDHFVNVNGMLVPDLHYLPKDQMKPATEGWLNSWAANYNKAIGAVPPTHDPVRDTTTPGDGRWIDPQALSVLPNGTGSFIVVHSENGTPFIAPHANGQRGGFVYVTAKDLMSSAAVHNAFTKMRAQGQFNRAVTGAAAVNKAHEEDRSNGFTFNPGFQ